MTDIPTTTAAAPAAAAAAAAAAASTTQPAAPSTKIGTEVIGVRVISGSVNAAEPGTVVLDQLYPGTPTTIGAVDSIAEGTGQVTIYPSHRREWTTRDRLRLAEFFAARHAERFSCPAAAVAPAVSPTSGAGR
ncbi:MAG TPA: hypothetical protein VGE61_08710 [Glycomyces sp.]